MNMREFAYYDHDRNRARQAAIEFAEYINGKVYHDEFNNTFIVFWGPGSEKLENRV